MADTAARLERGRAACAGRAWGDAYTSLTKVDQLVGLDASDLELLATAAYMLGRDDEFMTLLERAHHAHLQDGDPLPAVRCAFWLAAHLSARGDMGVASGWLGRAQRLMEDEEEDCVERGYLLIPVMFRREAAGDFAAAAATAGEAAEIGRRFGDPDLFSLAIHAQGQMLIRDGRTQEGLALLDEAMVGLTGDLSPIVSGLVYCGVILACQQVYELRRAQEWTAALSRWCEQQRDLVAFTGRCLTHRAEIMQVRGAWEEALEEARRAADRLVAADNLPAAGVAHYRQGELCRLRGDYRAAEDAYREASRCGCEPQPGLALLRLAQGQQQAAATAIRRAVGETAEQVKRAALLPAYAEIMVAAGDYREARDACDELGAIAASFQSTMLEAIAARARGAVDLAEGESVAALVSLRRAFQLWRELEAPYEAARARVLVAEACRAVGDEEAAALELDAAEETFRELGAAPDLTRVGTLAKPAAGRDAHGLTGRELEVLRLVAAGMSNREIASELVVSEHTVARHLQNIFTKLRISSRTAAAAFAFEHDLV
jgi:DNA-binding CsgD family transcriptional regulator/tetratricopeptide (TPR) repeat protein